MTLRPALLLSALLALTACSQQAETPAAPAAEAAPAATAATPATPAPASAPAVEAAAEIAPAATPDVPVGPAPVAGIDYAEIAGGQPFEPAAGRIEVAEVFSYTCPHCAQFEPLVLDWRRRQPADVKFIAVAGPFAANPEPFAKAYYAAESLGLVGKSHDAMFRALHVDQSFDYRDASPEKFGAFYAQFGVTPEQFAAAMKSFAVDAKVKRATQFIAKSGIEGTPSIVVAGKYRVTGKTLEDTLRITTQLVAKERAAQGG
ncbi:thiol:disulfide interchange protein DsbA/DsbL [Lysobacter solisilvae (ex Woo and Kim 2020)]|uniref:Thiol:disulfide interchange protein DsbA/DsbL n=1 Tax=Agrilutibacter terrestris TaxID=2865112 RepID=A0A7H0G0H3_9GAMM|nr:thiol:disulfide interchange protein DsbA/DsbL [Lysobacter terrestris]QNP41789.1 thiol:disulfide interchange protein DsbA/DsbL [Lysobacter terrestris]